MNSDTCARSCPQIFEYADVTLSDSVFPGEINQHGVSTILGCNSQTNKRKWRQHTILRMLNKLNLRQKHWALEWTRTFLNPKEKKIRICVDEALQGLTVTWKIQVVPTALETHDFCDTGAMLYQLNYETTQLGAGQFVGRSLVPVNGLDE